MLENRSIQEIEEEKRAKQEEQDCMELYDDKCYTPPLIDKPPPKARVSRSIFCHKILNNTDFLFYEILSDPMVKWKLYRPNWSC